MSCCRGECAYVSILIGIVAGVLLGVLYSLGFVATGIIFWLYLLVGISGVFLAPLYAASAGRPTGENCFCRYRALFLTASAGAIVAAAAGLILAALSSIVAIAIAIALATFFVFVLLTLTICIANCICEA